MWLPAPDTDCIRGHRTAVTRDEAKDVEISTRPPAGSDPAGHHSPISGPRTAATPRISCSRGPDGIFSNDRPCVASCSAVLYPVHGGRRKYTRGRSPRTGTIRRQSSGCHRSTLADCNAGAHPPRPPMCRSTVRWDGPAAAAGCSAALDAQAGATANRLTHRFRPPSTVRPYTGLSPPGALLGSRLGLLQPCAFRNQPAAGGVRNVYRSPRHAGART